MSPKIVIVLKQLHATLTAAPKWIATRPDDDCTASRSKKNAGFYGFYLYFQLTSQGMSWFVQKRVFYPAVQWLTIFPKFYQKIGILGVSIHLTGRSRSPPLWLAQSLGAVCVRQMLGVLTHRFECVVLKPFKMTIVLQHVATTYEFVLRSQKQDPC